jgi:hypothetical protein
MKTQQLIAPVLACVLSVSLFGQANDKEHTSAFDACSLLTPAQVQSIQSEPVTTKASSQAGEFQVYHCFYAAPHVRNSVSVQVIRGSATHTSIRDFWNGKFHAAPQERQPAGAHDASPGRATERDEEEQTGGVLEEIEGVGDEAYWTASRVASALYVLNGNEILRISVGGNDSPQAKLRRCTALARLALQRQ